MMILSLVLSFDVGNRIEILWKWKEKFVNILYQTLQTTQDDALFAKLIKRWRQKLNLESQFSLISLASLSAVDSILPDFNLFLADGLQYQIYLSSFKKVF